MSMTWTFDSGDEEFVFADDNNKKTYANESTRILIDDVTLDVGGQAGTGDQTDGGGQTGGSGTADAGSTSLEAFEAEVLRLTNAFRADNGKPPLSNDDRLNAAAEDWSRTMALDDFFAHSSPRQVEEQGYKWQIWGENIAAGFRTPEDVVKGWINSSGHRANMLRDSFEEIGIGHYYLDNDTGSVTYGHYWTQVFGTEV